MSITYKYTKKHAFKPFLKDLHLLSYQQFVWKYASKEKLSGRRVDIIKNDISLGFGSHFHKNDGRIKSLKTE